MFLLVVCCHVFLFWSNILPLNPAACWSHYFNLHSIIWMYKPILFLNKFNWFIYFYFYFIHNVSIFYSDLYLLSRNRQSVYFKLGTATSGYCFVPLVGSRIASICVTKQYGQEAYLQQNSFQNNICSQNVNMA